MIVAIVIQKMTNENNLKAFILYCQSVETLYKEWKDYWLNILITDKVTFSPIPHYDPNPYLENLRKIYKFD